MNCVYMSGWVEIVISMGKNCDESWRKGTSPVINLRVVIKVSLPADFSDPVGAGMPRVQGPPRPASKDSELATT
jgi:hypothetical protein